jgi:acyl-CoA thioester hydrolase
MKTRGSYILYLLILCVVCVDKVTSNKQAIPELIKQNIIAIEQSVGNNLALK